MESPIVKREEYLRNKKVIPPKILPRLAPQVSYRAHLLQAERLILEQIRNLIHQNEKNQIKKEQQNIKVGPFIYELQTEIQDLRWKLINRDDEIHSLKNNIIIHENRIKQLEMTIQDMNDYYVRKQFEFKTSIQNMTAENQKLKIQFEQKSKKLHDKYKVHDDIYKEMKAKADKIYQEHLASIIDMNPSFEAFHARCIQELKNEQELLDVKLSELGSQNLGSKVISKQAFLQELQKRKKLKLQLVLLRFKYQNFAQHSKSIIIHRDKTIQQLSITIENMNKQKHLNNQQVQKIQQTFKKQNEELKNKSERVMLALVSKFSVVQNELTQTKIQNNQIGYKNEKLHNELSQLESFIQSQTLKHRRTVQQLEYSVQKLKDQKTNQIQKQKQIFDKQKQNALQLKNQQIKQKNQAITVLQEKIKQLKLKIEEKDQKIKSHSEKQHQQANQIRQKNSVIQNLKSQTQKFKRQIEIIKESSQRRAAREAVLNVSEVSEQRQAQSVSVQTQQRQAQHDSVQMEQRQAHNISVVSQQRQAQDNSILQEQRQVQYNSISSQQIEAQNASGQSQQREAQNNSIVLERMEAHNNQNSSVASRQIRENNSQVIMEQRESVNDSEIMDQGNHNSQIMGQRGSSNSSNQMRQRQGNNSSQMMQQGQGNSGMMQSGQSNNNSGQTEYFHIVPITMTVEQVRRSMIQRLNSNRITHKIVTSILAGGRRDLNYLVEQRRARRSNPQSQPSANNSNMVEVARELVPNNQEARNNLEGSNIQSNSQGTVMNSFQYSGSELALSSYNQLHSLQVQANRLRERLQDLRGKEQKIREQEQKILKFKMQIKKYQEMQMESKKNQKQLMKNMQQTKKTYEQKITELKTKIKENEQKYIIQKNLHQASIKMKQAEIMKRNDCIKMHEQSNQVTIKEIKTLNEAIKKVQLREQTNMRLSQIQNQNDQNKLLSKDQVIEYYKEIKQKIKQVYSNNMDILEELRKKEAAQTGQIENLKFRISRFEEKHQQHLQQIRQYERIHELKRLQLDILEKKNQQLAQKILEQQGLQVKMNEEKVQLNRQLAKYNELKRDLQKLNLYDIKNIEDLAKENHLLKMKVQQLQKQLQQMNEQMQDKDEKIGQLTEQIEKVQQNVKNQVTTIQLKNILNEAQARTQMKNQQIRQIQSIFNTKVGKLLKQIEQKKTIIENLNITAVQSQNKLENFFRINITLENRNKDYIQKIAFLEKNIQQIKTYLYQKQEIINQLKDQNAAYQRKQKNPFSKQNKKSIIIQPHQEKQIDQEEQLNRKINSIVIMQIQALIGKLRVPSLKCILERIQFLVKKLLALQGQNISLAEYLRKILAQRQSTENKRNQISNQLKTVLMKMEQVDKKDRQEISQWNSIVIKSNVFQKKQPWNQYIKRINKQMQAREISNSEQLSKIQKVLTIVQVRKEEGRKEEGRKEEGMKIGLILPSQDSKGQKEKQTENLLSPSSPVQNERSIIQEVEQEKESST